MPKKDKKSDDCSASGDVDIEALAKEIYKLFKQELRIDRERQGRVNRRLRSS